MYVHVPFCARRCDYCAFAIWTDRAHLMGEYAAACADELRAARLPPAASLFVGGGTPSLLPAADLAAVVAAVTLDRGAEVTVECNPEDVSPTLLRTYRAAGVTRISLGVQSMQPRVLAALGRLQQPVVVERAAAMVNAAGFDSWNADLIFGAAGETAADWVATLDTVLAMGPPHVSAYALTVEAGTPLAADPARRPDDDDQADKYLVADEVLGRAGLVSYEVSNWARPGHECRHNLHYWSQGDYRGIGCAAHSHRAGRRWWNVRTPQRYVERVRSGRTTEAAGEVLGPRDRRQEGLQLALRTASGVPAAAMDDDDIEALESLVERRGDRVVLTARGRLLGDEVALRLR